MLMNPAIDNVQTSIGYLFYLGTVVLLSLQGCHHSRHPCRWMMAGLGLIAFGIVWLWLHARMLTVTGGIDLDLRSSVHAQMRLAGTLLMVLVLVGRSVFLTRNRGKSRGAES